MTQAEIKKQLQDIFIKLELPLVSDFRKLDSLARMMLILETEERFQIEFNITELSSDDYEAFVKYIYDKVN